MKKLKMLLAIVVIAGVGYFALMSSQKHKAQFRVEVDGMTIEMDKTTVKDLKDHGFKVTNGSSFALPDAVEQKSRTFDNAGRAMKDGKEYFGFGLINRENVTLTLDEAKIACVNLTFDKDSTYKDSKVMGFCPKGMNKSQVKAKLVENVGAENLRYGKSDAIKVEIEDYNCYYYFGDNGKLKSVTVSLSAAVKVSK